MGVMVGKAPGDGAGLERKYMPPARISPPNPATQPTKTIKPIAKSSTKERSRNRAIFWPFGETFVPRHAGDLCVIEDALMIELEKFLHKAGVEIHPGMLLDIFEHGLLGAALAIRTVGQQGVPDVYDRKDTRRQRDILALQVARVAAAVPVFVMAIGNIERGTQIGDRVEHLVGKLGMLAHFLPLFVRE